MKFTRIASSIIIAGVCILNYSAMAQKSDKEIDEKVTALMQKMTLEEKVGQMNQYNGFWDATGPAPTAGDTKQKYEQLKSGLVGSVLNVRGVDNVRKMQETVMKNSRLGIPLIFALDVIHGHKTLSPIPLAEAASWDLEAIEKSARVAAIEASAIGINMTFAPMVDITRDARWGRVMEGAGEDTYLGTKIGVARVKGFQGNDLSADNTILACAKHFAGYGFAEAGREYNTIEIGTSTLYNVVLPPFKAAVDAGVGSVMNSFNTVNGIPATGNKFLQRDILKDKWNFAGFVISDWGSGGEMIKHGFAKDLKDATKIAANAGSDMDMESYGNVRYLKELVNEGKVSMQVVDDAVKRILTIKFKLGLFDDPYLYCDSKREKELLYNKAHLAAARDMAKKSMVLLKNDAATSTASALLPLKKDITKLVVIGALAEEKNSPLGSWRIGSDDNTAVSVLEGLKNAGVKYSYSKGAELLSAPADFTHEVKINNTDTSGFAAAKKMAAGADVVLMVLGEHGFQTGEGRSRTDIGLPGVQQQLLEAIYKVNKNIVLVLMNGRPLALPWAATNIPAILETWQSGTESGNAIADVLTGAYNPSGKLPMSFPRNVGQEPLYYNQLPTGRPDSIGEVFWSHYTDSRNDALFPFGYGLSYTSFAYSDLKVSSADNKNFKVSVTLTNSGKLAGEEVVQLYIHDKVASVSRPIKELKGFQKIMLAAGQSTVINFTLGDAELGFFTNEGEYVVEPGSFDIMVGGSSASGLKSSLERE